MSDNEVSFLLLKSYTHYQMNSLKLTKRAAIGSGTSKKLIASELLPESPELQHISIIQSVDSSVVIKAETNAYYLNEPIVVEICKRGQQLMVKLEHAHTSVISLQLDRSQINEQSSLWASALLHASSINLIQHDFSARLVGSNCYIKDDHREGWLSPEQNLLVDSLYCLEDASFITAISTVDKKSLLTVAAQ